MSVAEEKVMPKEKFNIFVKETVMKNKNNKCFVFFVTNSPFNTQSVICI